MNSVQYITDATGHKTAVILPIEDYEEMLEDLYFGNEARTSKLDTVRPFDEIVKELRDDGEIDV